MNRSFTTASCKEDKNTVLKARLDLHVDLDYGLREKD